MPERAGARAQELVAFALERLPSMRLADGAFCHEVVAPGERRSGGRIGRGEAISPDDAMRPLGRSARYTLMVAIGVRRAHQGGMDTGLDPDAMRRVAEREIDPRRAPLGHLGLLAWEGARSGDGPGPGVTEALASRLPAEASALEGHQLAWVLTGCAEAVGTRADPALGELAGFAAARLLERARTPSGLLRQAESGLRSRFPHFATQIYGVLALTRAAEALGDGQCQAAARAVADVLLSLQRADGGWPWIYDTRRGVVVEPYRLYSVHQDAMAPMALFALTDLCGEASYAEAALRGLEWVWGRNELGATMLDREAGMLYRSVNRAGPRDRFVLWLNGVTALAGRPWLARHRGSLVVERTDRPYHLGWLLEAWTGRDVSAS